MIQALNTILPLSLLLQSIHLAHGNDLIDSPIFDVRPESKSLQEIQGNIVTQRPDLEHIEDATLEADKVLTTESNLNYIKHVLFNFLSSSKRNKRKAKHDEKKHNKAKDKSKENKAKWHKWNDWSTCSVTCGKGRMIRWRHCEENCDGIETEMEEIGCQLPECPRKLFGMIKLKK